MKIQNGACAPAGSACPQKVTELFYVTHPKATRALLGPFLTQAEAELGVLVMRSAGAVVTSSLVDHLDDFTRWHAVKNGQVVSVFAGSARHE